MDSLVASVGPSSARTSSSALAGLHSTTVSLFASSLDDHINDYHDAHRWIDSFFDKLAHKPAAPGTASRPAVSELMKTPGRKRTAHLAASANPLSTSQLASSRKDPVATLLFPAPHSAKPSSPVYDKENSPAPSGANSPRRALSPLGAAASSGMAKGKAASPLSPLRLGGSPRGVLSPQRSNSAPARTNAPTPLVAPVRQPEPEPEPVVIAHDFAIHADEPEDTFGMGGVHDLSNVMEEDEDEEEEEETVEKTEEVQPAAAVSAAEEEKADLSIIGEEEEDEDDSNVSVVTAPTTQVSLATQSSIVIHETQFSQPRAASPAPAVHTPTLEPSAALFSPQARTVSGASSVAPEADGDTSVPLNDAPSALRSQQQHDLSSSVPASANTRTPGNTARFGTGSYSAAKLGMGSVGLGSSPPVAPSTTGKPLNDKRTSTGGNGARLNFVGLPKKSLGLGLGLGRNWAANSSTSQVSDSQASSQSQPVSQAASAPATSTAPTSVLEPAQTGATTSTGATKRKSLPGVDAANKSAKVSTTPQTAQDQEAEDSRRRREALANRLHSMQARQSNLGGRTSNVNGPSFGSSMFGANKNPTSSMFLPVVNAGPASKPLSTSTSTTVFAAPATVTPATEAANPLSRRPSVMERVKSFEQTAVQDAHNLPSPSKIPAAFARPTSPKPVSMSAFSPRLGGAASPPASPRPLTRSATSGLPLATFASPKQPSGLAPPVALGLGSPKLGGSAFARSPPPAAPQADSAPSPSAPITISAILSPPVSAVPKPSASAFSPPPAPRPQAAFIPPAITVKPTLRSTTPDFSPPPASKNAGLSSILQRFDDKAGEPEAGSFVIADEGEEDELDDEAEEEEDEVPSIRAINASTAPSTVVEAQEKAKAAAAAAREAEAKRAAEQAARDLEEQEAERERQEQLQKRLPSLPEPRPLAPGTDEESDNDDDNDEEDEMEVEEMVKAKTVVSVGVVAMATKENLAVKVSPSKIQMPGTFGAAKQKQALAEEASEGEEEQDEEEDDELEADGEEEDDRTTMSMASAATTGTFNFTAHSQAPFKPVTAHKSQLSRQGSKTSLASSVSSISAAGSNRFAGTAPSGIKKPAEPKVKSIQRAAAVAKKEKEERDRKAALKEEKRLALEKQKKDEERKLKVEGLEKKRKEREEAAARVKANAAARSGKAKEEAEPAKKRKIEPEPKSQLKKAPQSSRPLTASTSSQHVSSLTASQGRTGAMGPPSTLSKSTGPGGALNKSAGPSGMLSKSTGASSMVGQKFMSAQIRLQEQANSARPAPTVPKPFNVSQSSSSARPAQQVHHTPKPEPEPYQELPEIDSEYSDSDDEAHEKKVASFPRWAQSPALAHALMEQRKVNPDEIFGPIPPLSIQEIFRSSSSAARLRARTSSAQWDGTDALSQADLARYQKAMGFSSGLHLQQGGDGGR
ncbi:hypothetical protein JCM8097_007806 [Rhodosporidiobolus ruineniae]